MNGIIESSVREYKNYPEKIFSLKENKIFKEDIRKALVEANKKTFTSSDPFVEKSYFILNKLINDYDMYYYDGTKVSDDKSHIIDGLSTCLFKKETNKKIIQIFSISILGCRKNEQ